MKHFSINLIPAVAAVCSCLLISSCHKNDHGPSETRRNLIGNWKVTAIGADQNQNKVPDLDEVMTVPGGTELVNTFAENGTGTGMLSAGSFPISTTTTWELNNGDKTLKVVYTASGIAITRQFQIVTITSDVMTLADTSLSPWTFLVSTKQ
jgi:hypothetical protein